MKKQITKRTTDFNQWYQDVIEAAELAENASVRGCMIMRHHGYAIWENIQNELDKKIKETGHKNVYFPLFVPKSTLAKEAAHVKGFAKESAVVTHHRLIETPDGIEVDPNSKLEEEEVIVRPTSEAVMYETFSKWIQSWRDLPLLVNQWANVVRWEMRTKLFLRTTEFLWQEGHTVHATEEEAQAETLKMLKVYKEFAEKFLALAPVIGLKSEAEKFPGALHTYTLEAIMQDGKALQSATSHNLGDNFAKAFDIRYSNQEGELEYAWQTSWGMSTRIIGGVIMTHGDDKGVILPPKVAPVQVAIIPIYKEEDMSEVTQFTNEVYLKLKEAGVRVELDDRDYQSVGYKFNDWEKKGVPLRLEIGSAEVQTKTVRAVERVSGERHDIPESMLVNTTLEILDAIQANLKERANKTLTENMHETDSYEKFKQIMEETKGFVRAFWCENPDCEEAIKKETKATTRCLELESKEERGTCIYCGKKANHKWLFAQAY